MNSKFCPLGGAIIEVWQSGPDGKYDTETGRGVTYLRGKFVARGDGTYSIRCLRPTSYSIDTSTCIGAVFRGLGLPANRPSHIHFKITNGDNKLVTQLFDKDDKFLGKDPVHAVNKRLEIEFKVSSGDCEFESTYNFVL